MPMPPGSLTDAGTATGDGGAGRSSFTPPLDGSGVPATVGDGAGEPPVGVLELGAPAAVETGGVLGTVDPVVAGVNGGGVNWKEGFCPSDTATPAPPRLIVNVLWLPGGSQ
jgi:hypothetical protein